MRKFLKTWQRFGTLLIAAKTLYYYWPGKTDQKRGQKLCQVLQGLGPLFIKFGQFFSLRPDYLRAEIGEQLWELLEETNTFETKEVSRIIKESFGKNTDELFADFSARPFAAASLGQVHKATLYNGETVAVKILRPGIKDIIEQDCRLLSWGAWWFDIGKKGGRASDVIKEFQQWLVQETNYDTETDAQQEFHQRFLAKKSGGMIIPKVFPDFCSSQVFTSKFIDGISLTQIIRLQKKPKKFNALLKKYQTSPAKLTKCICQVFCKQLFWYGHFHADPHPANLILMEDGQLAGIDFGMVGHLNDPVKTAVMKYVVSFLSGEADKTYDTLNHIVDTTHVDMSRLPRLKQEHDALVHRYQDRFINEETAHLRHFLGSYFTEVMALARRYNGIIPPIIQKYFRTISMVESLLFLTNPDVTVFDIRDRFQNFYIARTIVNTATKTDYQSLKNIGLEMAHLSEKLLAAK